MRNRAPRSLVAADHNGTPSSSADAARARPVTDQRRDAGPPQGARGGDAEDGMRHERQAVRPRRADVREVDARPGGHEQQHDTGAHGPGHTRQDRQRQHRDDDPAHGVEGHVCIVEDGCVCPRREVGAVDQQRGKKPGTETEEPRHRRHDRSVARAVSAPAPTTSYRKRARQCDAGRPTSVRCRCCCSTAPARPNESSG